MPSLKKVSATPMSGSWRNPENLNMTATVTSTVSPVRREKATYNHVKKSIKLTDMVKVEGICKDICLKSPVVLEYRLSAPEGVDLAHYDALFKKVLEAVGGTSLFIPSSADTIAL